MSSIAKVITVIGSSPDGFAEAAQVAVTEASKTLRGVSGAQVMSMSCDVTDGKITTFKTTVNIAFAIEGSRRRRPERARSRAGRTGAGRRAPSPTPISFTGSPSS